MTIYSFPPWARSGNGKELQFCATDEDVSELLHTSLPNEFAPYYIIGSDLRKTGKKHFEEAPFRFGIADFPACAVGETGRRSSFWLLSEKLLHLPAFKIGDDIKGECGCNGLILLQHGLLIRVSRGPAERVYRDISRIAIVTEIQNLETGEKRHVDMHEPIYKALSRAIKRSLTYDSLIRDADGVPVKGRHGPRMTARAYAIASLSPPFIVAPELSIQ